MRVIGSIRDWLDTHDRRRMLRRQQFPETIQRHYWDRAEYAKDATELKALGYVQASRDQNDPYVSATFPAGTGGGFGNLDQTVRRRIPSIHVLYRRRLDH